MNEITESKKGPESVLSGLWNRFSAVRVVSLVRGLKENPMYVGFFQGVFNDSSMACVCVFRIA